jgi:hypothetical protein
MPDDAPVPLGWPEIAGRLAPARLLWLHTTGLAGAPQVTAVWGAVVNECLYLYTERTTVKARNLTADPRAAIHLESGADVVIVYGELADVGNPSASPAVLDAFAAKYDRPEEQPFLPGSNPAFDVLYELEPRRALLWQLPDSEASMRRWSSTRPPPR